MEAPKRMILKRERMERPIPQMVILLTAVMLPARMKAPPPPVKAKTVTNPNRMIRHLLLNPRIRMEPRRIAKVKPPPAVTQTVRKKARVIPMQKSILTRMKTVSSICRTTQTKAPI